MLEIKPTYRYAWQNLGTEDGGEVSGQLYLADACFSRSWYYRGVEGGVSVGSVEYTEAECYIKAVGLDVELLEAWTGLGSVGGGQVGEKAFSAKQCLRYAEELSWT